MSRFVSNLLIKRQVHRNADVINNCKQIRNRNPRNLERLRIARKPVGYKLEKPGFSFWHKLNVEPTQRFVTAEIIHFENGPIITVSSKEWGLKTQLYSTNDATAYKFVGHVLAQRCLECGISEILVDRSMITGNKMQSLVNVLSENGITLEEPAVYTDPNPTYRYRHEKPWEIHE